MRKYLRGIDLLNGTFDARDVNLIYLFPFVTMILIYGFGRKRSLGIILLKQIYALIQDSMEKSDSEASNRRGRRL